MKNSHPIMKKYTSPIMISEIELLVIPKEVWTCDIPHVKNVINNDVAIIIRGLNLASQATMIAVNPIFFADSVLIVWLMLPASNKPISPHIAPEITMVLIITIFTFIPTYLAVF